MAPISWGGVVMFAEWTDWEGVHYRLCGADGICVGGAGRK